ncbi:MAG: Rpb4 family DNA-directed RNA polymerase subunit [Cuniculiplasma sp.]
MKIKYITTSEAREILQDVKEDTPLEAKEFEYVRQFSRLSRKDALKAVSRVSEISGFSDEVCVKIVDLMPSNLEQMIAILNSYKLTPKDEVLSSIIDYLKELL